MAKNDSPAKPEKAKGLRIAAKSDTFRRAGLTFTREPTDVPLAVLSEAQIKALKAEPMLAVVECEIELPAVSAPDA